MIIKVSSSSAYVFRLFVGYYMLVSSGFGEVGDIVTLKSPLLSLSRPTSLQFFYSMRLSNDSSSTARLQLIAYSQLGIPVRVLLETTVSTGSSWQRVTACLSVGNYSLGFVATIGRPFATDIAIDEVGIWDDNCMMQPPPSVKKGRTTSSLSLCLYVSLSLSVSLSVY